MENSSISLEVKSHFLRLYQIALTDDNFSHLEMQLLYKFAKERGISQQELEDILTGYSGTITIPETIEKRIEYLYDFALMIWADDVVTDDEKIALKKYILKFEFKEGTSEELSNYLLDSAKNKKTKEALLKELND
ncbi:hypothetical protein [Winogradskyella haliclonae]|uniref:TerB family tellurite resistance protein n=1 Tax=Winogradskyella haliclonae TaxID=2048558 RepID=A0ABQ2BYI9_9FLAO|nr:hypothetical protein [Winogradskyella haliclonae]GGI56975.1 hypothetical protein GCM10011444_12840 [Winogradskyella haliclonae]